MSLNIHPGVVCGYCIDPADAFLFAQINNGNALSLPFAKGFGWGAELNVRFIFEKAFTGRNGEGYPPERKEPPGAQCRDPQPGQSSSSKRELPRYPARHRSAAGENRSLRPHASSSASSKTARIKQSKTLFARSSLNRHQGQRRWPFRRLFFLLFLLLRHAAAGRFGQMQAVDHPYQTDQGDKHKRQAEADPR
ncbi:4-deoxy-L-threo-5-hexosulose-uronate ketol-isomerase [Klebsiella pneumoniae subsp. pneumoniae]|nr:4-deoxy-L-threo-5-hexosulose-uronate ketol-isomerase [Klebsiella pneumoniae subsp. pneumoniae]